MKYEKSRMAKWDEYAILKTAKEEGIEIGEEKRSYEVVKNLLKADNFSIPEMANFANVTETFVKKVRRELKK